MNRLDPRLPTAAVARRRLAAAAFAAGVATLLLPAGLRAADGAAPPRQPADASLPALGDSLRPANPYRGRSDVLAAGELAYQKNCASCHGESAARPIAEGPDLRRLNSFCTTLTETALRTRCLTDVDRYFMHSVREGKLRAGLMHMPAWKDVLPQETVWAIRSYTETRPLPPPRSLPDLPPAGR